jgi:hypothetical protein
MKALINQHLYLAKSKASYMFAVSFIAVTLTGCGGAASDNGQIVTQVEMPTTFTSFYCPNEGVGEESCVLFNPANPYARTPINSMNPDTEIAYKWELNNQTQSDLSRFYLWATAHARDAQGENQFYTAQSLHTIFSNEGSTLARDQAKLAYRSLLDNFFGSVTFTGPANAQVSNLLRNWVADRLVNPSSAGLPQLYDSQSAALQAIDDWGYLYDANTTTISRKIN